MDEVVQDRLELGPLAVRRAALRYAAGVLREYGQVKSAALLERRAIAMEQGAPPAAGGFDGPEHTVMSDDELLACFG